MSCPTEGCTQGRTNHRLCVVLDPATGRYGDVPNPDWVEPKAKPSIKAAVSELEAMAERVRGDGPTEGFPAAVAASEGSAGTWTTEQRDTVWAAITKVATAHAGGGEFTTDDIWAELAASVPVTKGMTAMLTRARKKGLLDSTGKTTIAKRGGEHDHAQRLTIWYSLIERKL